MFSKREIDVVRLMMLGFDNKELADKLYITEKTVKVHLTNIFIKSECRTRFQVIAKFYLRLLGVRSPDFNLETASVSLLEGMLLGQKSQHNSNELPRGADVAS